MLGHLQIHDRRERLIVAAADAGLALARAAGLLSPRRPPRRPAGRVLLLRLERIGDLLMTLDAIAAVRDLAPHAAIDLVVGSWNAPIARLLPHVDTVSTLDAPWLSRRDAGPGLLRLVARCGRAWAPRDYDVAINFEGDIRSHLLMARSRAAARVGFDMAGGGPLLTHRVPFDATRHTAWNALRVVRTAAPLLTGDPAGPLGPDQPSLRPTLRPPGEAAARVQAALAARDLQARPLIALHAGGGRAVKQWPPDRFGAAVGRLAVEVGAVVALTGDAGDRALVDAARAALPPAVPVIDLVGQADLVSLAAWLARSAICVTGDTGPMHLAAAVGTPVAAVFGPSDERRYAPLVAPHRIVARRDDLPCAPCNRIRQPPAHCRGVTPACLEGLASDRLYTAAREVWDEASRARAAGAAR